MNRGGAETFIMNIYRNIDRKKVQFDFLLHTDENCDFNDEIRELGGRIFTVSNPAYGKFPTLKSLKTYRKELNKFFVDHSSYKIVHAHMSGRSGDVLKAAKKHKVPDRIAHSHIALNQKDIKRLAYEVAGLSVRRNANHYLACSRIAGESLFGKKAFSKNQVTIVNNSIKTDRFIFDREKREQIRARMGLEDKFVIGSIARFSPQKNHEFIIDIFNSLYQVNKQSLLLLVGDGELKSSIQKRVENLGLSESVRFLGVRSDIPELLQAFDVFLFPSLYEGLGIVAIEAQAAGLPTIVSEHIPEEAYVTDLIEKEYLRSSPNIWAKKILKFAQGIERADTSKIIKEKGYDIKETAAMMQDFYIKIGLGQNLEK